MTDAAAHGDTYPSSRKEHVPADLQPRTGMALWGVGILLAMANFLAVLDMSIANVSVPTIAGNLGATASQGTWVITSYAVAEAIMVPLTGWLAGRFGTVRVFVGAVIGFGACSALCGLAPTLEVLVFFRVLQGVFGGPLMPLSQTLLMQIFPKEKQGAAMALWAMTTLTAPIAGPMLGGVLCESLGWPSIFWVNVPIALLCAPVLWRVLNRYETSRVRVRVDAVGLGLLILFVGALQLMLDLGNEHDWFESPAVVALAVIALVGFVAFLIWELTEKNPIVDLRIFRHRGFAVACLTLPLAFGGLMASNVLVPLWLQVDMGYTATWAGYVAGMMGVLAIFGAPLAATLSSRFDPRLIIFIGVLWLAWVTFMRAGATGQMSFWQIAFWPLILGIGMPLFFLPLQLVGLGAVKPEETASAAGLLNFIRTVAGAFATSLTMTLWGDGAAANQSALAGQLNDADQALAVMQQGGMSYDQAVQSLTGQVQSQAVVIATNEVMMLCAAGFLIAALTIWLAPRPKGAVDLTAAH